MSFKVVQRVGFGIIAIWLMILLAMADGLIATSCRETTPFSAILRQGSVIPLALLGLVVLAARELRRMLARSGFRPHAGWAFLMIAVLIIQPWIAASGWLGSTPRTLDGEVGQLILLVIALVGTFGLHVIRREPARTMQDVGATLLMIGYLGLLPSFAVVLRCRVWASPAHGPWVVLLVLLITKCSDIGGYLVGSVIGRHKLIPSISPAKSWEGLLGGGLLSAVVAWGVVAANEWSGAISLNAETDPASRFRYLLSEVCFAFSRLGYARAVLFGVVLAVVALIGDLFESCLKRQAQVKDSGAYIPTYGGILDLLDSPCATLPVAWLLLVEVWGIA